MKLGKIRVLHFVSKAGGCNMPPEDRMRKEMRR